MSDSYQAIYDAVRSRISGGDIGAALRDVAWQAFDISHARDAVQQEFLVAAYEMQRPSAVYRPALLLDGTSWCALYGEDLKNGVAGFGDTPAQAMTNFDVAWLNARTPEAHRALAAEDMTAPPAIEAGEVQRSETTELNPPAVGEEGGGRP